MRLNRLLSRAQVEALLQKGNDQRDPEIGALEYDSRRVVKDSLFFAIEGLVTDGHVHLEQALQKGAVAVVSEREKPTGFSRVWIRVSAIRPFMACVANAFNDRPSERLQLVGITGTNGKTTTAFLIYAMLEQEAPGLLLGTVHASLQGKSWETERTTPEAIDVQRILSEAVGDGCRWGAMEVSSHALAFHRVYRCCFPVGVFTNLSQDHLDFHHSLEEYFQVKQLLFDPSYNPGLRSAVLNQDDGYARRIEPPAGTRVVTFGLDRTADVFPLAQRTSLDATEVDLKFFDRRLSLRSSLLGEHNLYNLMSAAVASHLIGVSDDHIRQGVASLTSVPGRFERVDVDSDYAVLVDFAHTPIALKKVLDFCRQLTQKRVLCVFGCGGDRDRGKRPQMGAIAVEGADRVFITSDNPRSEDPAEIIREICFGIPEGCTNYETLEDRRGAIERALEAANPGDIVLVAGKGHETYQEIQGQQIPFDDREVVRELA
jgi:UDP-N-acetylmuramoyl-L-alanyl-D-glutamate--2,6-diaminopimelate ligase